MIDQDKLPDGALLMTFPITNTEANYVTGLTHLTAVRGNAKLTGNSFAVDIDSARVGPLAVSRGHAVVPDLAAPDASTVGILIAGFSSIFTGLNFISTTHKLRAPGMGWFDMPLFIWGIYATGVIQILATPVLAITLVLLLIERVFQIGIFDSRIGGDPVLFQHFFWFYSHPAVYIMILPSMGFVSDVMATFARKPIFGYKAMVFSIMGISGLGFIVWGHHMFQSGMNPILGTTFMISTMVIAVLEAVTSNRRGSDHAFRRCGE
jgi:heme/copper-type cytochrome/quinol oxidase subunit 1